MSKIILIESYVGNPTIILKGSKVLPTKVSHNDLNIVPDMVKVCKYGTYIAYHFTVSSKCLSNMIDIDSLS